MNIRILLCFIFFFNFFSNYGFPEQNNVTSIDSVESVTLRDSQQKIYIRSKDTRNPVVLYIHGGPAEPIITISHYFTEVIKDSYTYIGWDQRGCGLSYSPGTNYNIITEQEILLDAVELTNYLKVRFKSEKIFLLGHSFGSIIGYRLITEYPHLFQGYIGIGQVIDWETSNKVVKRWLQEQMIKNHDNSGLERTKASYYPDIALVRLYGGILHAAIDYEHIVRSSKYYYEGYFEHVEISRTLISASISQNKSTFSFLPRKSVNVPICFFVGAYDHTPASSKEVVESYYKEVKAPFKKLVWFNNSAHLPNMEEPVKFQKEIIHFLNDVKKRSE